MTDDIVARLSEIQKHALNLQTMARDVQSRARPCDGRGADPGGWVSVVVDAQGLPEGIGVRTGWQRQAAPEELGQLVMRAFEQAVAEVTWAWADSLGVQAWQPRATPSHSGDEEDSSQAALQQACAFGAPRDPLALTEEALKALSNVRDMDVEGPATATGFGDDQTVSVTLGIDGLRSCTINPRWAAQQGASGLNPALAQVAVLLKVYAKCIVGQDKPARDRIEEALKQPEQG